MSTELNKSQSSALSRLFSPGVFKEMAKKGKSPLCARLLKEAGLFDGRLSLYSDVSSAFENAFSLLRKNGIRDEYVYKSALTHNVLLGRHSLRTASMLTEFRVGECKADLVILNGTSTVYEIKSDRDSLSRLPNQLENYQRFFPRSYVITSDSHLDEVLRIAPNNVGVMRLARWNRISTIRKAQDSFDNVCPAEIFESLRVAEAKEVLRRLGEEVPDVPNTELWKEMRQVFSGLPVKRVHEETVFVLKKARGLASLSNLVDELPPSLKPAALSFGFKKTDQARLLEAINTPLRKAMEWG